MSLQLIAQIYTDDEDELVSVSEVDENDNFSAVIKPGVIENATKAFKIINKSSSASEDSLVSGAISIKNELVESKLALPRRSTRSQVRECSASKKGVAVIGDVAMKTEPVPDSSKKKEEVDFSQVLSKQTQATPKYKCPYCFQPFIQAFGLTDHLIVHTGKRWKPPQAKPSRGTKILTPTVEISKSSTPKIGKMLNRKVKKPNFKCGECKYACHSKVTLEIHMKLHTEKERPFKCSRCTCSFWNRQALGTHAGRFHKDVPLEKRMQRTVSVFKCRKCNYSCNRKLFFHLHMRRHLAQAGNYKCFECSCYFRSLKSLGIHKGSIHRTGPTGKLSTEIKGVKPDSKLSTSPSIILQRVKIFKCSQCSRYFATDSALKLHETSSHQVTTSWKPQPFIKFQCNKCSFSSNEYSNYQAHILTAHGNNQIEAESESQDNIVKADNNKRIGSSLTGTTTPFEIIEQKDKSGNLYESNTCQKMFSSSDMKRHLISHTTEQLFQCRYCVKSFKHKRNLRTHIKDYHKMYFKNYIKVSTEEMRENCKNPQFVFKCHLCENRYNYSSNLRRHVRTKHEMIPK